MSHGAKIQEARLGKPGFSRAAQKKKKNGPRQNVTEEYDSHKNVTATYDWASTRNVPRRSL